MKKLHHSVIEKLQYYVYILIDPRDKSAFYIWKWTWNRIYAHMNWALKWDGPSDKTNLIREILFAWLEVDHRVVRHWLTEKEALEVEWALIDFHWKDNLTNKVLWHNSNERWIMTIDEININYNAQSVEIDDSVILININNLYHFWIWASELYEATRKSWALNPERANKARYAFCHYHWIVREVYELSGWNKCHDLQKLNNVWYKITNRRFEFTWTIATKEVREKYLHKSIEQYFKPWSQNPIKYVNV
jgi:hypothetical protein